MLDIRGIGKYYGNKMAIQDISFSAREGQIVGVLGHNGSGKSTTMNIITGCLTPSKGEVWVDGISIEENPIAAKMRIGYLPEIPPVYLDMTVEEQLQFACGLRRIPRKDYAMQIENVCTYLNIGGVKKRLIQNLSKGYRQRVGFAQALIGDPPVLILDEPMVGLDPQQIMELRDLIVRLKEKHTIILSSHILSEIAATCDRLVVLSNGQLVADNTLNGLLEKAPGKREWILKADGTKEQILTVIYGISEVENCLTKIDPVDGEIEYHIHTSEDAEIHRKLFIGLAQADCPIRLLQPLQNTLEDIFLKLTQDRRYKEGDE